MSPYEYMDLSQGSAANALSMLTFGFTMLCGYLFVAYAIGDKLKSGQVIAITSIYAISYIFNMIVHVRAVSSAVEFSRLADQLSIEAASSLNFAAVITAVSIRASIFLVSLWFMWDVRHQKSD